MGYEILFPDLTQSKVRASASTRVDRFHLAIAH